jgi:hypothetical protein
MSFASSSPTIMAEIFVNDWKMAKTVELFAISGSSHGCVPET